MQKFSVERHSNGFVVTTDYPGIVDRSYVVPDKNSREVIYKLKDWMSSWVVVEEEKEEEEEVNPLTDEARKEAFRRSEIAVKERAEEEKNIGDS